MPSKTRRWFCHPVQEDIRQNFGLLEVGNEIHHGRVKLLLFYVSIYNSIYNNSTLLNLSHNMASILFCCARAPSANLSRKARLSRVHLEEVELAKGVRGN